MQKFFHPKNVHVSTVFVGRNLLKTEDKKEISQIIKIKFYFIFS